MAAPKLDAAQLAARYGYAAHFFNSVPELKTLLAKAVAGQWTPEQFSSQLMNTSWYKYSSALNKEWQALKAKEPAEANRQLLFRVAEFRAQAAKLGIQLTEARLKLMAEDSIRYGFGQGEIGRALAAEMKYDPDGTQLGDVGASQARIKETAAEYGINLGDREVFSMSQKMLEGSLSEEGIAEQIKSLAKSRYPGMADEIDKGLSLREVASAYVQAQSKILEINPDQIDLATDRNLQKALQYVDPATGKPGGAMPLWQYEESLKKDTRWLATGNAHDEIANVGTKVLKDMGLMS
jgi:hypothetical protein